MIAIDGSFGEGGGQILRSSLTLSLLTKTPFTISKIRNSRKKPGLRLQHLEAVRAAREICNGEATGDLLGSKAVTFIPQNIIGGKYRFRIKSAGSANLLIQTIILPLLRAKEPSTIEVIGGTHNPKAPTFDYLDRVFIPILQKMGANISVELNRFGFFPRGGGSITLKVSPSSLTPINLAQFSKVKRVTSSILSSSFSQVIIDKQAEEIKAVLGVTSAIKKATYADKGNIVSIEVERENRITELFTAISKRNISPHISARVVAKKAAQYISQNSNVGSFLADQLLIPVFMAESGEFTTDSLSLHTKTNMKVIEIFTGQSFEFCEKSKVLKLIMITT